jgi:hypothetical protein
MIHLPKEKDHSKSPTQCRYMCFLSQLEMIECKRYTMNHLYILINLCPENELGKLKLICENHSITWGIMCECKLVKWDYGYKQ